MMNMTKTRYIGLGIIVICVFLFVLTFGFPSNSFSFESADYGPTFFPRVLAVLIGVLALIMVISDKGKMPSDGKATGNVENGTGDVRESVAEKNVASKLLLRILGITFIYLLIMQPIGYFISTVAYMFLSIWILRPKKHIHSIWLLAGSIAFTLGLQYLFGTVMNVLLPLGLLK
ncbi:MAG: tripartite tricarboxylate transporter TctB family protein [Rectinemataceae bacterium]